MKILRYNDESQCGWWLLKNIRIYVNVRMQRGSKCIQIVAENFMDGNLISLTLIVLFNGNYQGRKNKK